MGEVGVGNGKACWTWSAQPICWRKATKLVRPPKGVMALGVSSKTILAPPNSGVKVVGVVLLPSGGRWFFIEP